MESNSVLLSICIPTYNGGSSLLKVILDSLIPEIQKYNGLVEVVVSDNCSSDNTNEILESFDTYHYYRHYRNSSNLGFNGNMLQLADKYAEGEYCWFNGDDDIIRPHFLPFLYDCLKKGEYDYLSIRYERLALNKLETAINQKYAYHIEPTSFAKAIDQNCLRGNSLGSFMSSAVFRTSMFKDLDKSIFENKFDTFYNVFPNAYLMATGFYDKRCAMICDPGIIAVCRDKDWATSDNMYFIVSSALVGMYDFFIELGIKPSDLRQSRKRLVYDNIRMGLSRILKRKKVETNFFAFALESLRYPRIYLILFLNIIRKAVNKPLLDI